MLRIPIGEERRRTEDGGKHSLRPKTGDGRLVEKITDYSKTIKELWLSPFNPKDFSLPCRLY